MTSAKRIIQKISNCLVQRGPHIGPWKVVLIEPLKFGSFLLKVEKILKGSLDSIPSPTPSVKIEIMGGNVCLRFKGKTLLGVVNKLFVFRSF